MSKAPHGDPTDLPKGFSQPPLFPVEEVSGHPPTPQEIAEIVHLAGGAVLSKPPEGDETSAEARQIRESALTEGSGVSTSLARRRTGQEPVPYRPPKPVLVVKAPKQSRYSRRGGRSFPESDRDYVDEMAGPLVGPLLTPEQQRIISATGALLTKATLQEALQTKQTTGEQVAGRVRPWVAPDHVGADMRLLGSDPRAGFRPSTDGERTVAIRLLERLNPDLNGPNGLDTYLARQHRFIKLSKQNSSLSEIEKQSLASASVRKEIAGYGWYAHDHAQKLTEVRSVSSFLEARRHTEKIGDLLMQLPNPPEMKRGLLVLVQHAALREVAMDGQSSMGVSPFLNLGTKFDEVAARLDAAEVDGHNKRDQVLRYAQEMLDKMTVADAKKTALVAVKFQWNGVSFWSRILESISGSNAQIAKEALEAVWRA